MFIGRTDAHQHAQSCLYFWAICNVSDFSLQLAAKAGVGLFWKLNTQFLPLSSLLVFVCIQSLVELFFMELFTNPTKYDVETSLFHSLYLSNYLLHWMPYMIYLILSLLLNACFSIRSKLSECRNKDKNTYCIKDGT